MIPARICCCSSVAAGMLCSFAAIFVYSSMVVRIVLIADDLGDDKIYLYQLYPISGLIVFEFIMFFFISIAIYTLLHVLIIIMHVVKIVILAVYASLLIVLFIFYYSPECSSKLIVATCVYLVIFTTSILDAICHYCFIYRLILYRK
ncbi:hypothetical protein PMAYCL1PPCAC_08469, partial [Pristionchus mayeri]